MAKPWEFDIPTPEEVKAQQTADATPVDDTWGHFMDVVSNSLGRGLATSVPYLADVASVLNRRIPVNPKDALLGRGKFTQKASQLYSKVAGDEVPLTKAEERASTIAQGIGAAALPLGEVAGIPRALAAGAAGGAGAQIAHEIFPESDWAPLVGGLVGGVGPHFIEGGVRSAAAAKNIRAGASHPAYPDIVNTIVDLEGGGTLANPKVSPKGAMGVMQVMPDTARDPGFGIRPWDGKSQADLARVGRQYAAALTNHYDGDTAKVLAAYNGGFGRVDSLVKKFGDSWYEHLPSETRNYVYNGLNKLGPENHSRPDIRLVQDEQPPTAEQALINESFAPKAEPEVDPNVQELLNRGQDSNVADFTAARAKGTLTDDDLVAAERMLKEGKMNIDQFNELANSFYGDLPPALINHIEGKPFNPEDVLTPAERQDMDASVPKPVVDNTGYEKHTPYRGEPTPPANDLDNFHAGLMKDVKTRAQELQTQSQELHDNGTLPYEVGDRIHTPKAKELGQDPWEITGYFVDPKTPDRYGYRVARGEGDDAEHSVLLTSDPTFDAKYPEVFPKGRDAHVAEWQHLPAKGKKPVLKIIKDMLTDDSGTLRGDEPPIDRSYEGLDPEQKLEKALRSAVPVSAEQRRAYKEARAERAGYLDKLQQEKAGLSGFKQQAASLKGELPKAKFNSIAEHFTEEDINTLLNRINGSKQLLPFEKFRAQGALLKLLGSEGAKVPTPREIKLLSGVLHENIIKLLLDNRTLMSKFWHGVGEAANFPRTIMASFDLSAPLRQGAFFIGRPQWWSAFASMFKQWGSEKAFQAVQQSIRDHPNFLLAKKAGLAITDASGHFLSDREEAFMSHWAEKIPGVRMSDRAYSGFLNKLRFDVFNSIIEDGKKLGYNWDHDTKALKQLGNYVNAGSGRGNLGKFAQAAPVLNSVFFSPRYVASRFNLLNLPYYLFKADPLTRKNYLRDLTTYVGVAGTVLALAKMSGAEVNLDWKSSDFLKIKIGNTRRDILSGFGQIVHLVGQLATGQYTNAAGKTTDLGSGYGVKTRLDVLWNFIQSKFSPTVGWAADELRGTDLKHPKDLVGQEHTVTGEAANHLLPLSPQDIAAVLQDNGVTVDSGGVHGTPGQFSSAIEPGIESTLGVGIQTYQPRKAKVKGSKKSNPWEFGPPSSTSHKKQPWEF